MKFPAFLHFRDDARNESRPHCARLRCRVLILAACAALSWLLPSPGQVATLENCKNAAGKAGWCDQSIAVGDIPLYLVKGADPNFFMTLDSSASMLRAGPEANKDEFRDAHVLSSVSNPLYYNPEITYLPPKKPDGTSYPSASFKKAPGDFFRQQFCGTCSADSLVGSALSGSSCASLCPPAQPTECSHNLASEYAAVDTGYLSPCHQPVSAITPSGATVWALYSATSSERGAYVRDPNAAAIFTSAPDNGSDWAMLCMHHILTDGSSKTVKCPAYYYRLANNTYTVDGDVHDCATAIPDYSKPNMETTPAAMAWAQNCLQRVIVGTTEDDGTEGGDINHTSLAALDDRANRLSDCPDQEATDSEQVKLAKCNFANWYAFYNSRWRTLQTVVTRALADLTPSARVGYQGFPNSIITAADYDTTKLLQPFGAAREDSRRPRWFQDWLFATLPKGTTPLIESALRILQFAQGDPAYLMVPQAERNSINNGIKNELLLCRNNFHLLFTDGAWNKPSAVSTTSFITSKVGNADGTTHALPTSGGNAEALAAKLGISEYTVSDLTQVFADENSGGLADVVFYSWITDLRDGDSDPNQDLVRTRLPIEFSTSDNKAKMEVYWSPDWDPADWQHITTYTVGFGLQGHVTPDLSPEPNKRGLYDDAGVDGVAFQANLVDNGFPTWADADSPDEQDRVDDLWHAGLNGRGAYWAANNPDALISGFKEIVSAVNDMTDQTIAATAAPAINTGGAAAPRIVFQAVFDSESWTGDLRAFRVSGGLGFPPCASKNRAKGALCEDPTPDPSDPKKTLEPPYWSAAEHLTREVPPAGVTPKVFPKRTILTGTRDAITAPTGINFASSDYSKLSLTDRSALLREVDVSALDFMKRIDKTKAIIDYVAGSETEEDNGKFRKRTSVLGDIINGAPLVVSAPHRAYKATRGEGGSVTTTGDIIGGYPQWAEENAERKDIVYVGANDGMLHAFDAGKGTGDADDTGGGTELFAYVPRPLFSKLSRLTSLTYGTSPQHTSFVDGLLAEGDAFVSGKWKSVVVGALGLGAQAIFAIQSPDAPDSPVAANVHLWDFTDRDDPDMGYVMGKPTIARVLDADGEHTRWVAIFGNGVNSSEDDTIATNPRNVGQRAAGCTDAALDKDATICGQAVLYVVPLDNKESTMKFAKFSTQVGRKDDPYASHDGTLKPWQPNGLSQPTVLGRVLQDADGNVIADGALIATAAYAGDLYGNLWRFDLTKLGANVRDRTATLIFTATDQDDTPQPITAPVVLAPHPTGVGTIVLFGTGRYLGEDDRADSKVQTFYGIWDRVAGTGGTGRTTPIKASELQRQYFKKEYAVSSGASGSTATVSYGRTSTRVNFAWAADPSAVAAGERMGWRIDLGTSSTLTATEVEAAALANQAIKIDETGERVVVTPQLRGERVVFVSLVPETNLCEGGGYGWVNTLAYATGSALDDTPYDYNQDGTFDSKDLLTTDSKSEAGTSIRLEGGGVYSATAALPIGAGESKVLASDSKGKLIELLESSAMRWRVWRQVR